MTTIKGPGIFLAQFLGDEAPFNSLESICKWAKSLGYAGVQIPTWDPRCIDLQKAAESKTYADEIKGLVNECGLEITELSTHLQGQLVAVNPAYDLLFDGFAPASVHNNPKARTEWGLLLMQLSADLYYGIPGIHGLRDQKDWLMLVSKNWQKDGCQS
jgi:sugar phosphate isomerase/epimerase